MWIFRSVCNTYVALTHVPNRLRMSAPMILLSPIVCFRYWNTRLNLDFTSLVLSVIMMHRNDITGSMLGLPLFDTYISFSNIDCSMSASFFSILMYLSSMFCKKNSPVTIPSQLAFHRKNWLIPQCYISWTEMFFRRLMTVCPFPVTWAYLLLILWIQQNVWLLSQLLFY